MAPALSFFGEKRCIRRKTVVHGFPVGLDVSGPRVLACCIRAFARVALDLLPATSDSASQVSGMGGDSVPMGVLLSSCLGCGFSRAGVATEALGSPGSGADQGRVGFGNCWNSCLHSPVAQVAPLQLVESFLPLRARCTRARSDFALTHCSGMIWERRVRRRCRTSTQSQQSQQSTNETLLTLLTLCEAILSSSTARRGRRSRRWPGSPARRWRGASSGAFHRG